MGLFSAANVEKINKIAAKSKESLQASQPVNARSMNDDLHKMSLQVMEYFKDSPAILITTKEELHNYVDKCIEVGYAGIDTETTGLDRIHDWIVGASLYTPGLPECYIPMKHIVPIFDTPYKDQLSYEEVGEEFQRLVDNKVRLIFANADFDLAMIYKDLKVDMIPAFYYDVILAWRCIKENELDNSLKGLYAKYPMKGKVDPKKFSDFFSPKLFPYCKPKVAKLYAANDAKITYDLFLWQLPYVTSDNEKCKKHHFEKIANIVWNIEFPMVSACALLHRRGIYLDDSIAQTLHNRYTDNLHNDEKELAKIVQELIDTKDIASNRSRPFRTGSDFNPNSQPHVKYLVNNLLGKSVKSTGKEVLKEINQPATNKILDVRGDVKLLGTYVDKLPNSMAADHRIHGSFKSVGAATGRMCIAKGQLVNTPRGMVEIQTLKVGDEVYSLDIDNQTAVVAKVLNVWKTGSEKECVKVTYGNDFKSIICTPEHPFFHASMSGDYKWTEANNLHVGDILTYGHYSAKNPNGTFPLYYEIVNAVSSISETFDVYDIEVENHHNFFVNGICVHNSSESPNMQNVPSHAKDIRHMFRATPEYLEYIDLTPYVKDNKAVVTLSMYDSIKAADSFKALKDFELDEDFWFGNDTLVSSTIQDISFDLGQATFAFEVDESDKPFLKLQVMHPPYIIMSSDYSQQEPRLSAYISQDRNLVDAFKKGRDAYATLVSAALKVPYEECLEFHPVTGELQPEGKERRSIGKVLNLGVTYGMSVQSISESLFGTREDMSDDQKLKEATQIHDSLMKGFPDLARAIARAQQMASTKGYTETILGRRRYHPDMQLPRFEFVPMDGYTNPDIDPLDPDSLQNKEQIPQRILDALSKEFKGYKYYGKIVKRTKELAEEKIKVINNSYKIESASRQCFNAIIQGSAADLTKMAILKLENDKEWKEIGGRFILPIHDELMCEVPLVNAEKGAAVLARCMEQAGNFLPFPISCDVESTYRWYGLGIDDIASREKPDSLDWDNLSTSNIEWIQCMIIENEYPLPVFKEEDGSKPSGVRAKGVNGKVTDELKQAVLDYRSRYKLGDDKDFLDHIEAKVTRGVY